jgi:hypothetical protein
LPVDDPIVAGAPLEPIAAGSAVDPVVAVAAVNVVVAGAAVDHVMAVAAVDDVVAGAAVDHVVAVAALDAVMTVAAVDAVVAVAAVQVVVAVATVDEVVAVPAEDAGPSGTVGAELVVAGTPHDPLAGSQPDDEVHPTAHTRQARPRGRGHLRVGTEPRPGIEPYQPGREAIPARARPPLPDHHRDDSPHTDHHRQHPNHGPCPARESNCEHPRLLSSNRTDRSHATPNQQAQRRRPPPTAPTLPDGPSPSKRPPPHSAGIDNAERLRAPTSPIGSASGSA